MLPGLLGAASVLALLHLGTGLTPLGWSVGTVVGVAAVVLLGRGLARAGSTGPRPADQVTLARVALVAGVAALVAVSVTAPIDVVVLVGLATVALVLDAADGELARRTHTESALGARFDMEVDAFLILVLSAYVARDLGWWVLAIGLARYVLLAAGFLWPWLRRPTPPRRWAKVVAAIQGIVLTAVAADVLARPVEIAVTAGALALLVESFGHQVGWLARHRVRQPVQRKAPVGVGAGAGAEVDAEVDAEADVGAHVAEPPGRRPGQARRAVVARGATVVAVAGLWAALVLPDRLDALSAGIFVQIPAEGLVLAAAALLLPPRPRRAVAAAVGGALGLLVLLKILNLGYYATLNRAFNPVMEWGSLGPAFGVLSDSVGSGWAYVTVAGGVLLAVAIVTGSVWASLRLARTSVTHRVGSSMVVGALSITWVVSAAVGLDVVPHTPVASQSTISFAAAEVQSVAAAARDRKRFAAQLAAADPYSSTPVSDLLAGLRGKDVIVAFVESYGRTAVEGSTIAPGISSVLDDGTRALDAAGFGSRSAFLTSPTFGGVSWLAHATLQSGMWVDNRQSYGQLLDSSRLTLSGAFRQAGWRTVLAAPANTLPWPEGRAFYGYDQIHDATNTGYRGPRFSYATMPDQYTLAAFQRLELAAGHRPVMAEIDLVSSHIPWTPVPQLVDWRDVGDGSVFRPMAEAGPSAAEVYGNDDELRAAYGRSIEYSLQSLMSFVEQVDDDDLVLVVLGDHQPSPRVTGPGATHDVPITVIARDPAVLDRISPWHWSPGLRPAADAPVWRMDAFRDRFLEAFGAAPLAPPAPLAP